MFTELLWILAEFTQIAIDCIIYRHQKFIALLLEAQEYKIKVPTDLVFGEGSFFASCIAISSFGWEVGHPECSVLPYHVGKAPPLDVAN